MTATERALLDVLGRQWQHNGALEQAMVEATGLSPVRCWQTVNALLDSPAAWEYAPAVCRALDSRRRR